MLFGVSFCNAVPELSKILTRLVTGLQSRPCLLKVIQRTQFFVDELGLGGALGLIQNCSILIQDYLKPAYEFQVLAC